MNPDCGIYQLRNLRNGKVYVGSAKRMAHRWRTHQLALRRGEHHSKKMQRAWDKYGEEAFTFELLEPVAAVGDLLTREQHWIEVKRSATHGYNVAPVAGSQLGYRHSAKTLAKMSAARTGKTNSPEARRKISIGLRGKPKSAEHVEKVRAAMVGRVIHAEWRAKNSLAQKNRPSRPCSPETRAKIAAAHLGKPKPKQTPESIAKRVATTAARRAEAKAAAA